MLPQVPRQDQIDRLNERVRFKLAPSKIHGTGLFAIRDISKGTPLHTEDFPMLFTLSYKDLDKLFPEIKELILSQFPNIINGSKFAWPTVRWQAYINHAPTKEEINYDTIADITTKEIFVGDEILQDYTRIPNYGSIFTWLKKDN